MSDVTTLDLEALTAEALAALDAASDLSEVEDVRVRYTGRRSALAELQRQLGSLDPDARRALGAKVNAFREAFAARLEQREAELAEAALAERFTGERVDVTEPPRRVRPGRPHLLTRVQEEIVDAFVGLGYEVAEGPEVESAVYNFDLLNIPADHPARQEMDTIYVDPAAGVLLRAHTSPVQVRVMLTRQPPIAVVCPGRAYRNDAPDATHSPVFHQVEGLLVAEGVTMADLRGTLRELARALLGPQREVRLRPGHFPFTEPSAEIDVSCGFCDGNDPACRVCSGTGWIEILGAGMVHENVLSACGHDPRVVSGFAFGVGVERLAMLRHGVADIREFFENDARLLEAF